MLQHKLLPFALTAALAISCSFGHAKEAIGKNLDEGALKKIVANPSSVLGQSWRNLLFIQDGKSLMLGQQASAKKFYLSSATSNDQASEELDAVLAEVAVSGYQSPKVCDYPARFNWVHTKLHGSTMPFPKHCEALSKWIAKGDVHSVDLLFVSGYLSNPASTFGHTLLNVRTGLGVDHRSLEDSMNYGALVPPGEGVAPYIFKGLFGGYSAGFSDGAYSAHMNTYQEKELREIWRYELNLTDSQRMDFVYRMAEVVSFKFPYYFLSENCGWAMGRMISEVSGASLKISHDPTWFAPIELIQLLKDAKNPKNGTPLVKNVQFTAAGQSVLQARYEALDPQSKQLYHRMVRTPFDASKEIIEGRFQKTRDTEHALDAALSYWQTINLDSESERFSKEKDAVLKARLSLPAKAQFSPEILPYPNSIPHESQKSGQVGAGFAQSNRRGVELSLKFASFEQGDSTLHPLGVGRALSVFVFKGAISKGNSRLDEATVLAVSSVGVPDDTGLSEYGGLLSWQVRMGLGRRVGEPDFLRDLDKGGIHGLRPKFTGALGLATTDKSRARMLGIYLEPELGTGEHPVALGWLAKAQYRPNNSFSTTLDLRLRSAYSPVSTNNAKVGLARQSTMFVESNSVFRVSKDKSLNLEIHHSDLDYGAGVSFSHTY